MAYCPGYTDADGNWNNGFPCKRWGGPDENYCCGDDNKRFCCPERNSAPSVVAVVVGGNNDSQSKVEFTRFVVVVVCLWCLFGCLFWCVGLDGLKVKFNS